MDAHATTGRLSCRRAVGPSIGRSHRPARTLRTFSRRVLLRPSPRQPRIASAAQARQRLDDIQGALTLYGVAVTGIPFPPRDQVLDFFLSLENEYRDTLGRQQNNQSFVDAEGSAVWFPEFLRYVLNDCSATKAAERVLLQIGGQGIQPVCGVVASGVINFPPRNESLDFLVVLDTYYADELNRSLELSYIDLEGKAVCGCRSICGIGSTAATTRRRPTGSSSRSVAAASRRSAPPDDRRGVRPRAASTSSSRATSTTPRDAAGRPPRRVACTRRLP